MSEVAQYGKDLIEAIGNMFSALVISILTVVGGAMMALGIIGFVLLIAGFILVAVLVTIIAGKQIKTALGFLVSKIKDKVEPITVE